MIAEELAFFDTRAKLQLYRGHSRTCPVRLLFTYASTPGVHLATVAVDKEYGGSSVGQVASLRRFGLFAFLVAVVAHRLSRSFCHGGPVADCMLVWCSRRRRYGRTDND